MSHEPKQSIGASFIHSTLDDAGLTPVQFRVFCHLLRRAGGGAARASAGGIASVCRLNKKTVWEALEALEKRGMIERKSRPGDTTLITPTRPTRWVNPNGDPGPQTGQGVGPQTGQGVGPQTGQGVTRLDTHEGTPLKVLPLSQSIEGNPYIAPASQYSAHEKSFALEASPKASSPKAKPKPKREAFAPPTLETWMAYADTLHPPLPKPNAYSAFNHYEANGWMVGKNKMKNWHAACRTCHGRWINDGCKQPAAINGSNGNH